MVLDLRCLQLQQTCLTADHVTAVEWEKAAALQELDITATDLPQPAILDVLTRYHTLKASALNFRGWCICLQETKKCLKNVCIEMQVT